MSTPGAGIYFFWQLGCAQYMKENCDLTKVPCFVGASAGSLTAAFLLSNADLKFATQRALDLADRAKVHERKSGLAGVWGVLLREWLQDVIPDTVTAQDLSKLHIAVTPTFKASKLVTGFQSKSDLVDACLASCHVPLFLDGRPFTEYRGEPVLDGSFWYFVTKNRENGLPLPSNTTAADMFWVDYGDDEPFMNSISGNILAVITPAEVVEMVEAGYNYMKREHYAKRLPMAISPTPTYVRSSLGLQSRIAALRQLIPDRINRINLSNLRDAAKSSLKWVSTSAGAGAAAMATNPEELGREFENAVNHMDSYGDVLNKLVGLTSSLSLSESGMFAAQSLTRSVSSYALSNLHSLSVPSVETDFLNILTRSSPPLHNIMF